MFILIILSPRCHEWFCVLLCYIGIIQNNPDTEMSGTYREDGLQPSSPIYKFIHLHSAGIR